MIAATPSTIGAPALDVDRLLQRLPADLRAQVKWTRKPITDALDALLQSPGDPDVLEAASRNAMKPIGAIMQLVAQLLASPEFAVQRASLMSNLEADQRDLSAFVADPGVVDTLDWCLSFIKGFYREVWSHLQSVDLSAVSPDEVAREVDESAGAAAFRRGVFALMAASEAARRRECVDDAVTLVNVAFLELEECRHAFAHAGVVILPFADETSEQRLHRMGSYVARMRESLTDSEFRELDAARLTSLRE